MATEDGRSGGEGDDIGMSGSGGVSVASVAVSGGGGDGAAAMKRTVTYRRQQRKKKGGEGNRVWCVFGSVKMAERLIISSFIILLASVFFKTDA